MKYDSKITSWGKDAIKLFKELNYLIIFNDDAPPELAEISILHEKAPLYGNILKGDTFIIGEKIFDVTAIGNEAYNTFKELGHATLNFSGENKAPLPGHIVLYGNIPLLEKDIQKGIRINIY
ncbi:PTS glucitol/sorbitol transporter subunit IIA [Pectinatus frisingensis]|uniref:PTS glucitol/sorbitol transporter subunit IIA n=1 Tax=Pectinatus frisingensis TaxID=865 RepID=UPI0015F52689|nr:PTS glucitol/sorbitol transporter subunit IIA [Pectinatus frisingensis]